MTDMDGGAPPSAKVSPNSPISLAKKAFYEAERLLRLQTIELHDPAVCRWNACSELVARCVSQRKDACSLANNCRLFHQIRHGCNNTECTTRDCLSCQNRLSKGPYRPLTTSSARALATFLASEDHPERYLCPHLEPVPLNPSGRAVRSLPAEEVKMDHQSFIQKLFNTETFRAFQIGRLSSGSTLPGLYDQQPKGEVAMETREGGGPSSRHNKESYATTTAISPSEQIKTLSHFTHDNIAALAAWSNAVVPHNMRAQSEFLQSLGYSTPRTTNGGGDLANQSIVYVFSNLEPLFQSFRSTHSRPKEARGSSCFTQNVCSIRQLMGLTFGPNLVLQSLMFLLEKLDQLFDHPVERSRITDDGVLHVIQVSLASLVASVPACHRDAWEGYKTISRCLVGYF